MTLRQTIESLSSLKNSKRVEDLISKSGVQFQATPEVVDILKQFGASAKLISMIPPPPPPVSAPATPATRTAGPLSVVCEPKDCVVVVGDKSAGATEKNRKTFTGLAPGDTTVQVFADGYENLTRQIRLEADKPSEEKFSLKRSVATRQQIASVALLKALAALGGIDGLTELSDIEGTGTMQWTNGSGMVERWALTFNKRIGRDLVATLKADEGQCTATILGSTVKQECKGGLKNSGEKIAEQGATIFLSYQVQDVIQSMMKRPLITSETDDNRLESVDDKDAYYFTLEDGLPTGLVYKSSDTTAPIQVQYSDYLNVNKGRFPGKISLGRLNETPTWVFRLSNVRSKVVRSQPAPSPKK
jgi:hypothetical protein